MASVMESSGSSSQWWSAIAAPARRWRGHRAARLILDRIDSPSGVPDSPHPAIAPLAGLSRAQLARHLNGDRWRDNQLLNCWERLRGSERLESHPWKFSVPFVLCNAKCEFCSAWLVKGEFMDVMLLEHLDELLPFLREIDMVGWGEPLIHPHFDRILTALRERADRRAHINLTTNGVHLDAWVDRLLAANVRTFGISMHAATGATHIDLMGLKPGDFDRIVAAVRRLTAKRAELPDLDVQLVFIVTRQNIAEIPAFLALANELRVDIVLLRTLQPRTEEQVVNDRLDYQRLPPYLHPDFEALRAAAVAAIAASPVRIEAYPETWSTNVFPPEAEARILARPLTPREARVKVPVADCFPGDASHRPMGEPSADEPAPTDAAEDPYGRRAPLACPAPYTSLYVNGFHNLMTPCCYMTRIPGHEPVFLQPGRAWDDAWNSPAMRALRRALREGPLMQPCRKCPMFR
jgi:pyruvate-formate lyase-activating enzyme